MATTRGLITNQRRIIADDVSFDVWVPAGYTDERAEWPPQQFDDRDSRLALLTDLWERGLGPNDDMGPSPVVWNAYSAHAQRTANFLLLSEPTVGGTVPLEAELDVVPTPGETNDLADVCFDAIRDLIVYGGCVLLSVDGAIVAASPTTWYPVDDGTAIIAQPWESNDDRQPGRITLSVVDPESGLITTEVRHYDGSRLGPLVEEGETLLGGLEVVARDPRRGIWGRSKLIEMHSVVTECSRRLSRNSRIFDLFSAPMPVFRQSDADADARFGVPVDADAATRQRAILAGQLDLLAEDSIHLPDNVVDIAWLQPSVQGTSYALSHVTDLRELIRDITGLPDLTGQTLSGEALKRLHIHWYAETSSLQNSLRLALERLGGFLLDWPHVFDAGIFTDRASPPPGPASMMPQGELIAV